MHIRFLNTVSFFWIKFASFSLCSTFPGQDRKIVTSRGATSFIKLASVIIFVGGKFFLEINESIMRVLRIIGEMQYPSGWCSERSIFSNDL